MEAGQETTGLITLPSSMMLLLVLAGMLGWIVVMRRRLYPKNLPPGFPAVPIVGSLPFMSWSREIHQPICEAIRKYGDIFHLWLGNKLVVVLGSYELIREAFLDNAAAMAGRPTEHFSEINPHGKGIAEVSYSPEWKRDRNLSLTILKEFGFSKSLMEDRITEQVDATIAYLDTKTGAAFDPNRTLQISVSNVVCSIALGKCFKPDDREFIDMLQIMDQFLDGYNVTNRAKFFPVLKLLPGTHAALKAHGLFHAKLLDFLMSFIKDHKKTHVKGDESDFIHAYLEKAGDAADDESLVYLIRDLFLGGTETTSSPLRWAFVYMANYPEVQKKVQEELDRVLVKGRLPSLRDKADLPYTEAVMQEVLRLAVVGPQSLPHETMDDVTVSGYSIPMGTLVLGHMWGVQRDPKLWPEPDKLKPERFLTPEGEVLHRSEFIPFSLGRRACMGKIMARQEIFLFFVGILQNYSIERPDGVDKIDEDGVILVARIPKPFEIVLRKRT